MRLLDRTLVSPVPFSHLAPAFVIMLLAFACVEEDDIVFVVASGRRAVLTHADRSDGPASLAADEVLEQRPEVPSP
jgi:hypothetical protein